MLLSKSLRVVKAMGAIVLLAVLINVAGCMTYQRETKLGEFTVQRPGANEKTPTMLLLVKPRPGRPILILRMENQVQMSVIKENHIAVQKISRAHPVVVFLFAPFDLLTQYLTLGFYDLYGEHAAEPSLRVENVSFDNTPYMHPTPNIPISLKIICNVDSWSLDGQTDENGICIFDLTAEFRRIHRNPRNRTATLKIESSAAQKTLWFESDELEAIARVLPGMGY